MERRDGPKVPYTAVLGRALFERRKQLGGGNPTRYAQPLPLRAAAAQIGVSAPTLSRVERGDPPDLESFRKICLWLGLSADELLGLNGEARGAARVAALLEWRESEAGRRLSDALAAAEGDTD